MAELVEAAKSGDLARVRRCVLGGSDVNSRCPPDGSTALYWAACGGHAAVCDWLIGYGADVRTATTKSGSTALHGSADRGHHDCVDLLVKRGSHVNAQTTTNGDTALHLAAYRGHLDVCRLLVANDADASIVNRQGRTALEEAKIKGHGDVCRLLALLLSRHSNSHPRRQDFSLFPKSYSAELSDDKIPAAEERLQFKFFRDDLGLDLHHHHHHHCRPDGLDGPTTPLSFAAGAHPHRPRSTAGRLFDDPGPEEAEEDQEDSARQLNRLRLRVSALETYAGALETQLRLRDGSLDRLRAENADLRRQLLKTTEKSPAATQQQREEDELSRLRRQTDECSARTEQAMRELDDTRRRYRHLESVVLGGVVGRDRADIGQTEDKT